MSKLNVYATISKVDEDQRMVYGYASTEALDQQGERVSKDALEVALPDYMKFANVREMHGNSAVGTAEQASIDEKGLYLAAKIVDDNAWKKVKEKVYKGFSIGGKKIEKIKDTITKLNLTEISLVDRPANPEAVFDVYKADMSEEKVPDAEEKKKDEASQATVEKIAERKDVNPKEGERKYGKVKFADPKNKKYPIDTEEHIRAAWNYINKEKNAAKYNSSDLATMKRRIIAAWKKVIDSKGPPSAAEKLTSSELTKGMYEVSNLACMLASLDSLEFFVDMEQQAEGDSSQIPARLRDAIKNLGDILRDMVDEEVDEMTEETKIEQAKQPEDLMKAEMSNLIKKVEDLTTTLSKMAETNQTLEKRVKELEALPMPAKGILKSVGKSEDVGASTDLKKKMDEEKNPMALIKMIHEEGGKPGYA